MNWPIITASSTSLVKNSHMMNIYTGVSFSRFLATALKSNTFNTKLTNMTNTSMVKKIGNQSSKWNLVPLLVPPLKSDWSLSTSSVMTAVTLCYT